MSHSCDDDNAALPMVTRTAPLPLESHSAVESILKPSTPLLELDPGALLTAQVVFGIPPGPNHRKNMGHASTSAIRKASSLVQLELDCLEELPHIPKHYTLLLPGLSAIRVQIAETLLSKGAVRLAGSVADRFPLSLVDLGVNSLLKAAQRHDELQSEGSIGATDQLSRFQGIAEFLNHKMDGSAFNWMINSLTELWESQPIEESEAKRQNAHMRISLLKSMMTKT